MARQLLRSFLLRPWGWSVLAALVTGLDYVSGPWIQLPIGYAIPVMLASWCRGPRLGLPLAIGLSMLRPLLFGQGNPGYPPTVLMINAMIRAVILVGLALLAWRLEVLTTRVKQLEDLLPVCAWCRRIRTGEDAWVPLESYLAGQMGLVVTHGICPECRTGLRAGFVRPGS
jgi:hypothetical protein